MRPRSCTGRRGGSNATASPRNVIVDVAGRKWPGDVGVNQRRCRLRFSNKKGSDRLCRKPSQRPQGARFVGRRCIVAPTPGRLHCRATILPCNGCNDCNDATILGQTGTDADSQRHRCNRCIVASLHATMQRPIVARHDATTWGQTATTRAGSKPSRPGPGSGFSTKPVRPPKAKGSDPFLLETLTDCGGTFPTCRAPARWKRAATGC
jgi:hypothetical protein